MKPGRSTKRASAENIEAGKNKQAIISLLVTQSDMTRLGHWSEPIEKKDPCRLCQAYS